MSRRFFQVDGRTNINYIIVLFVNIEAIPCNMRYIDIDCITHIILLNVYVDNNFF